MVRFTLEKRLKAGKPVELEYVEITGMGTGSDVIHRAATDEDREKYKAAYAEFKAGAKKETKPEPVVVPLPAPVAAPVPAAERAHTAEPVKPVDPVESAKSKAKK
jgi:hypothetical protein